MECFSAHRRTYKKLEMAGGVTYSVEPFPCLLASLTPTPLALIPRRATYGIIGPRGLGEMGDASRSVIP